MRRRWPTDNLAVKILLLGCAFFTSAFAVEAQPSKASDGPSIEILKLHWEKQVQLPRNYDPSILSTGRTSNDPVARTSASGPATAADATRAATSAQSEAAAASTVFPATPARLPVRYAYSMKIRNVGTKTITAVAWDYVFADKPMGAELGRHQFLSYEKVAPGKSVTFKSQLRSPPTRVVNAANGHDSQRRYAEVAMVQCVIYGDNSVWKSPQARPDTCSLLSQARPVKK
ncbi:MAG TPA: hypothetical protein VE863_10005 [Pyrinomonadaceae bacterium]|jgi:hypothetical protein|nr:hypothetical protein [Pyrinomonadaceae bacterium]